MTISIEFQNNIQVDDLKDEEKRSDHAHGIVFFFGDLNRDGALTEVELRRLFSGNVFAAHLEDLIRVLLSRDLDNSQSLDVHGTFSSNYSSNLSSYFK